MRIDEHYLEHFGTLGMKWGHRKYINREGSLNEQGKTIFGGTVLEKDIINSKDRTIREGTVIQNISKRKLQTSLTNAVYASYTKYDNDAYGHVMGNLLYSHEGYKNTFLAKKDIKVASDKKAVEIFLKTVKENPDEVANDMVKAYSESIPMLPALQSVMRRKVSSLKLKDSKREETQQFAAEFLKRTLASSTVSAARNRFYANIIKEGYDAISDPNDRDAWAHDPLIVINTNAIKGVKSMKLTGKDLDNYSEYFNSKEHTSKARDLSEVQK